MSDSVQVAGDILHALTSHLGISELSCVSEFPEQIALARTVLKEAVEGSSLASRMQTDVAEVTVSIKSLVCFGRNTCSTVCRHPVHKVSRWVLDCCGRLLRDVVLPF